MNRAKRECFLKWLHFSRHAAKLDWARVLRFERIAFNMFTRGLIGVRARFEVNRLDHMRRAFKLWVAHSEAVKRIETAHRRAALLFIGVVEGVATAQRQNAFVRWYVDTQAFLEVERREFQRLAEQPKQIMALLLHARERLLGRALAKWRAVTLAEHFRNQKNQKATVELILWAEGVERAALTRVFHAWRGTNFTSQTKVEMVILRRIKGFITTAAIRSTFGHWRAQSHLAVKREALLHQASHSFMSVSQNLQRQYFVQWLQRVEMTRRLEGAGRMLFATIQARRRSRLARAFKHWHPSSGLAEKVRQQAALRNAVIRAASVRSQLAFACWRESTRWMRFRAIRERREGLEVVRHSDPVEHKVQATLRNISTQLEIIEARAEARRLRRMKHL
eukprot:c18889_g1_i3.p1 GENE.c18889_g1_i3~~c18889_g1_i3.p1  ORF type:complete len:419 (+),score=27.99 c18889_g1_i3:84-1259(+)